MIIIAIIFFLFIPTHANAVTIIYVHPPASSDTYTIRYNSDHGSGTNYAYTSNGSGSNDADAMDATASAAQNNTSGGTYSLLVDGAGDSIDWTTGTTGYVDSSAGSLEMYVYVDAASMTGEAPLFELYPSATGGTNLIRAKLNSNGTVNTRHEGNNVVVSFNTTASISLQTWQRLRFRWTVSGDEVGVRIGTGSWESDSAGDPVTAFSSSADMIVRVGAGVYNGVQNDDIYIDDFEIIGAYNTFND